MFFLGPWEKHHIAVPLPYFGKSDILRGSGMKDTKCGSNLPHFQPEGDFEGCQLLLARKENFHSNGPSRLQKWPLWEGGLVCLNYPKGMDTVRIN